MGRIRSSFARGSAAVLVVSVLAAVPSAAALGARTAPATTTSAPSGSAPSGSAPRVARAPGGAVPVGEDLARAPRSPWAPRPAVRPRSTPKRALLVRIVRTLPITSRPGRGRVVGTMPARSKYLGTRTVAWVMARSPDGRFGRVAVPYSRTRAMGWISLEGLARSFTPYSVRVDLSKHELTVFELSRAILHFPAATGAPSSPTPKGQFFVSDRLPVYLGSPFGSFAFAISGIQPNLPPGWSGSGDQLAIHGTNDPASIGRSVSAGCVRVSEPALAKLETILRLGTPIVIVA